MDTNVLEARGPEHREQKQTETTDRIRVQINSRTPGDEQATIMFGTRRLDLRGQDAKAIDDLVVNAGLLQRAGKAGG